MKSSLLILTIGMIPSLFAQNDLALSHSSEKSCEELKSIYFIELREQKYKEAAWYWQAANKVCGSSGTFSEGFFTNGTFIYHSLAKNTTDKITKQLYHDTLVTTYQFLYEHYRTPAHAVEYAYYAFRYQKKSGAEFDQLWSGIHDLKEKNNPNHLSTYAKYSADRNLREKTESQRKLKSIQLLTDYFLLQDYNENGVGDSATTERIKNNIDRYLILSFSSKTLLSDAMEYYLNSVKRENWDKKQWEDRSSFIINHGIQGMPSYGAFLADYIEMYPSYKGYMDLAEYHLEQDNEVKGNESYMKAIDLAKNEAEKDTIRIRQVAREYKNKNYKKAYSISKKIQTSFKGEALEYRAYCVAALAKKCGNSTIERKANYYYAQELLNEAKSLGREVAQNYKDLFPTVQDLHEASLSPGQKIELVCWNVFVKIPS